MATGFILAGLTAFFFGLQGSYGKVLTGRVSSEVIAGSVFFLCSPFMFLLLYQVGIPDIDWPVFLSATTICFFFNLFAFNFFFKSLSLSPLYLSMPFTALTPLFLIPVAWFTLGELPDRSGFPGILLIILGVYFIHIRRGALLEPFMQVYRNRGTRYMLYTAMLWAVSGTVEKSAVLASSPVFYGALVNLLLGTSYLVFLTVRKRGELLTARRHWRGLLMLSLISLAMMLCQLTALTYLPVSYVLAFKRGGVLISVLAGHFIFAERNILKNLFASLCIICGAWLIML